MSLKSLLQARHETSSRMQMQGAKAVQVQWRCGGAPAPSEVDSGFDCDAILSITLLTNFSYHKCAVLVRSTWYPTKQVPSHSNVYIYSIAIMALVSYVDILEVVGELKDFKAKLIEGEKIAHSSGIVIVCLNERVEGVYDISASVSGDKLTSHSVTITVERNPRLVDGKCSCLDGKSGKCQHVVATLIHLHRNNITAEFSKELEIPSAGGVFNDIESVECENHDVHSNGNSVVKVGLEQKPRNGEEVGRLQGLVGIPLEHADVKKIMDCRKRTAVGNSPNKRAKMTTVLANASDTSVYVQSEQPIHRSHINADIELHGDGQEITPSELRMGRGHRKSIPNPKYISDSPKYPCAVCSKHFDKRSLYEEHVQSHSDEKPFVCELCGECYSQECSLVKHKEGSGEKACRAKGKSQCDMPITLTESHNQVADQSLNLSDSKCFECPECDESFSHKTGLDVHLRLHGPGKLNSESEDNKFTCDVCGKVFKRLLYFQQHKSSHDSDKTYHCEECGKTFSRLRTFKAHKHREKESSKPVPKTRPVIKCETCGKEFTNRMHHEEHVRSHTGERPFQCVVCGKGFASKRSLRNHSHNGKNTRDRPHTCPQCPATFATAFMLKTHKRCHSDEKPFNCAECGKSYRSQHVYQDHLNHHKGIQAHNCKECGKSFTWRTSLWAHVRDHAREKPFECAQCGVMFAEQSELKDHWQVHLDDKPHQCPECGLGFMLEDDCQKHIEIHKKLPSYACKKCDQKFALADELQRHMPSHKEKKKFLCPTCGQTFSSRGHLKVHSLIHSGVKPFECETCHKRFYTRSLLRKHTVFHSNARPFGCELCGDKFPTQGILRAHIRTHTGEKPYSCKECGKSFPQSTYLKRHMLTHTGEKPHPCPECESAFVSRYDLKIHMRTHTGEKPFKCDDCGERFYERSQLTSHQRSHTGEKAFMCDVCSKGFNSSNHLKKHFSRVHQNTAPFCCEDCGERFLLCEALRKHKKHNHPSGSDIVQQFKLSETLSEEKTADSASPEGRTTLVNRKDPLNRLIEDSKILIEDPSNHSSDEITSEILTHEFEIVQVDLVDSSQLIKLPDGYECQTVQVYHADSLVSFEETAEFQNLHISSIPKDETGDASPALPSSSLAELTNST